MPRLRRDWLVAAALAGVAFAVFFPALGCKFVSYDDPEYVTANPHVRQGLSAANASWALTTFQMSNWNPLTWLSLQLDATLWRTSQGEPEPWGFHLTNVLLHAANAALLYLALRALTGAPGRGAAVALLFAVHPLRVESVAWVTERKDVLSIFFGLLALWAYAVYAKAPSASRYLAVAAAFALSLCAKPALVAFPCLLPVLDWWPLGRVKTRGDWRRLAVEKAPLLALAIASCAVTAVASARTGATRSLERVPPGVRVATAAVNYGTYLWETAWPFDLAAFYPHPGDRLPAWQVAGAVLLLAAVSTAAVVLRRRAPYVLAGWLWYLGMLVPVIGLVPFGDHTLADRYTYFPQIGVLVAVCWGAADLLAGRESVAYAATGFVAAALVLRTEDQIAYWRDSAALWNHAVAVTGENPTALLGLGALASDEGQFGRAEELYRKALARDADFFIAHLNLGTMLALQKRWDEAEAHFERACELQPNSAAAHLNLGHVLFDRGDLDGAERELERTIELAPETAEAYWHLARVWVARGRSDRAVDYYEQTLRYQPDFPDAHYWLARALFRLGRTDECVGHLRGAVRRNPSSADAHLMLAQILTNQGDRKAAAVHFETVTRLDPKRAEAWYGLGVVHALQGSPAEVERELTQAVESDPTSALRRSALAGVLQVVAAGQAANGRPGDAAATERRARDLVAAGGAGGLLNEIEARIRGYEQAEKAGKSAGQSP